VRMLSGSRRMPCVTTRIQNAGSGTSSLIRTIHSAYRLLSVLCTPAICLFRSLLRYYQNARIPAETRRFPCVPRALGSRTLGRSPAHICTNMHSHAIPSVTGSWTRAHLYPIVPSPVAPDVSKDASMSSESRRMPCVCRALGSRTLRRVLAHVLTSNPNSFCPDELR
jgi:hypothetical protein